MKQKNVIWKRVGTLAAVSTIGVFAACSSAPKANVAANANPNEEISKLNADISNGETNDFAVLDHKDFEESKEHLTKAEEKLRDNKSQEDVLNEIRISRGFYERAAHTATERRSHVQTMMEARGQALTAGAMQYPLSRKELEEVDESARKLAESNDTPASDKVNQIEHRYGDVQLTALEAKLLGNSKASIEAADSQGAKSKSPKSFNQAKVDYDNAKNLISMNRTNANAYMPAVNQANLSVDTLVRVMDIYKKDGKKYNENEAIKIVSQERAIHSLDAAVTDQQAQKTALQEKMSAQGADLKRSNQKVALQKALQSAQDKFSSDEAEVYQKDNSLLIRLKSIGFASGSAKLPTKSDDLLNKVQTIVESLKPESVMIQGHTDSIGPKAKNEKLSAKRAEEVASYFEKNGLSASMIKTEGFGDSKPLSTNKTKEGRAENRRIDIIVTPSDAQM